MDALLYTLSSTAPQHAALADIDPAMGNLVFQVAALTLLCVGFCFQGVREKSVQLLATIFQNKATKDNP